MRQVVALALHFALLCLLSAQAQTQQRPNIVLYLADDLGAGMVNQQAPELGFFDDIARANMIPEQRRIQTPTLERLAREGKRFLRSYASSSLCSPSRHSLMTGVHVGRQHVRGNGFAEDGSTDVDIEEDRVTIAAVLKANGYRTKAVGKWGMARSADSAGSPCLQGFDSFFGKITHKSLGHAFPTTIEGCTAGNGNGDGNGSGNGNGNGEQQTQSFAYRQNEGSSLSRCFEAGDRCAYFDWEIRAKALDFVSDTSSAAPFFLYWATTAGHTSLWAFTANRNGKKGCVLKTHPVPSYGRYTKAALQGTGSTSQAVRGLMAMTEYTIDEDLRLLLEALDARNASKDTLVVFASDNGAHKGAFSDPGYDADVALLASGGLRGVKREQLEGGLRSPTIAWWPGRIAAGTTSSYPILHYDLALTLAEAAGVSLSAPELAPMRVPNAGGASQLASFLAPDGADANVPVAGRQWAYAEVCFMQGTSVPAGQLCPVSHSSFAGCGFALFWLGEWPNRLLKLVQNKPRDPLSLFNVANDPFEQTDLAEALPETLQALVSLREASVRTTSCAAEDPQAPVCLFDDVCNAFGAAEADCLAQAQLGCEWDEDADGVKCATRRPDTPSSTPSLDPTATPSAEPASARPSASPSASPSVSPNEGGPGSKAPTPTTDAPSSALTLRGGAALQAASFALLLPFFA